MEGAWQPVRAVIDGADCDGLRELPDMTSPSEGGGARGKADVDREVAGILYYESVRNANKGGGDNKIRKFCGCH